MKPVAQNIMHTLVCIILTYNIIDCRAVSQGAPGSRQQPQGRGEDVSCGLGLRAVEWWFGVKAGLNWNPSYGCKLSWDKICMSFFFHYSSMSKSATLQSSVWDLSHFTIKVWSKQETVPFQTSEHIHNFHIWLKLSCILNQTKFNNLRCKITQNTWWWSCSTDDVTHR